MPQTLSSLPDAVRPDVGPDRPPATVFLVCLNGFSIRYLLRSDVLKTLKAGGARCVVLFGEADDPHFQQEFADSSVLVRRLRSDQYRAYEIRHPLARFLKSLRRFTLNGKYDMGTLDIDFELARLRAHGQGEKVMFRLRRLCTAVLKRSSSARRALVWLESKLFAPAIHQDLFDEFKPDAVVLTSLGYLGFEYYVMREARRNGARILSVILSWDNTSSKGIGGERADYVVTWTEVMKREVMEYHEYPADRIAVGGVAHFDDYARGDMFLDKEEFLRLYGLDPDRRIVFFAAKTPSHYPWVPEIVEVLASAAEEDRFAVPCQVLVRIHPAHFVRKHAVLNAKRTVQEMSWSRYEELQKMYRHLHYSVPRLRVVNTFDFDRGESQALASILKYSDVVLSCFSTVNIEAAIFDRPIVNVGFNGTGASPSANPRHNLALDENQVHNQRVVRSGAVRIARSPDQLIREINEYLLDPSRDRIARAAFADAEGGRHLGSAGRRIGELILGQLDSHRTGEVPR